MVPKEVVICLGERNQDGQRILRKLLENGTDAVLIGETLIAQ